MGDIAVLLVFLFPVSVVILSVLGVCCLLSGILWLRVKRSVPGNLVTATGIMLVVTIATYVYPFRPTLLRSRQVRTLADMDIVRSVLAEYRAAHGEYPDDLETAFLEARRTPILTDAWGTRLVYESRGASYVLASLGADRRPDTPDFWEIRRNARGAVSVAGQWKADQVASDLGWHRRAGK